MVEFDFESVMDGDAHINPLDMELLSREAGATYPPIKTFSII